MNKIFTFGSATEDLNAFERKSENIFEEVDIGTDNYGFELKKWGEIKFEM